MFSETEMRMLPHSASTTPTFSWYVTGNRLHVSFLPPHTPHTSTVLPENGTRSHPRHPHCGFSTFRSVSTHPPPHTPHRSSSRPLSNTSSQPMHCPRSCARPREGVSVTQRSWDVHHLHLFFLPPPPETPVRSLGVHSSSVSRSSHRSGGPSQCWNARQLVSLSSQRWSVSL